MSRSLPDLSQHSLLDEDHSLRLDRYGYLKLEDDMSSSNTSMSNDASDYEDPDGYLKPIEDINGETVDG